MHLHNSAASVSLILFLEKVLSFHMAELSIALSAKQMERASTAPAAPVERLHGGAGGPLLSISVRSPPSGDLARMAVVISHPYGPLGGNQENNVVMALWDRFYQLGCTVCKFDFRGCGRSKGSGSWRGGGEQDDVRTVCRALLTKQLTDQAIDRILIVGYSYGSAIACSIVDEMPEIVGFVAVAYPLGVLWAISLFRQSYLVEKLASSKPKLFIIGSSDNFTSGTRIEALAKSLPQPSACIILEGNDHFFFNREKVLCDRIIDWLRANNLLPQV